MRGGGNNIHYLRVIPPLIVNCTAISVTYEIVIWFLMSSTQYAHVQHSICTCPALNTHMSSTQYAHVQHSIRTCPALNMHMSSTQYAHVQHSIRTCPALNTHMSSTQYAHVQHSICTRPALNMHTSSTQYAHVQHSDVQHSTCRCTHINLSHVIFAC